MTAGTPRWLSGLVRLLERRTGFQVRQRQADLLELDMARLSALEQQTPQMLLERFERFEAAEVWIQLLSGVLVHETHFYRVQPQMRALSTEVLPRLLEEGRAAQRLRLWCAGCSTGEEAYTLSVLLIEAAEAQNLSLEGWRLELLGTDLSEEALKVARAGRYGPWSFRGTPEHWQSRYFNPPEDGRSDDCAALWEVKAEVRRGVRFAVLNLVEPQCWPVREQPFDLILCRNVTLYFRPEVTTQVYMALLERLRPGGMLMLGPSDPPPPRRPDLMLCSTNGALWWQKGPASSMPVTALPCTSPAPSRAPIPVPSIPVPSIPVPSIPVPSAPRPSFVSSPERPRTVFSDAFSQPTSAAAAGCPEPSALLREQLEVGLDQLEHGEHTLALAALRQAAFLAPQDPWIQFLLGRVWLARAEPRRARRALLQARRLGASLEPSARLEWAPELSVPELLEGIERLLISLDLAAAPFSLHSLRGA